MSSNNKPCFLAQQVDAFYAYMATVYLEYYQLKEKPVIKMPKQIDIESDAVPVPKTEIDVESNDIVNAMETIEIEESRVQTFPEYFLYKLYYNYGVKRRMVNTNIALLFYAKALKGYNATDPITMLCRHMMLDTRNMRIISLGIPKAIKLEQFCKQLNINPEDATTNIMDNGISKFQMYKFPEGTMITYNPSLAKYNINTTELANQQDMDVDYFAGESRESTDSGESDKEAKKHSAEIEATIQTHFSKQIHTDIQYSTRKVVGTGKFSSLKTFMELFNENNEAVGINLSLIPSEVIQDKALVFNIEHSENQVVSTIVRNHNTLCAVYHFKSDLDSTQQYKNINKIELQQGIVPEDEIITTVRNLFQILGQNMVKALDLKEFNTQLQAYGVSLFLPDCIYSFGNTKQYDYCEKANINIWELNINQLNDIVQNRPKDFQGYIIYGKDGSRTKIMNAKYKDLKILKGNKPIVIEQWNTKNLFYLYWRLMKLHLIPQFIKEFDMPGGTSYNQLFYWFASLAHGYSVNLFRVYHNSFVKKNMDKYNIPYSMKPMCGDIHNMYKATKVPISQSIIEQYIFNQSAGKIFWRIFSGK